MWAHTKSISNLTDLHVCNPLNNSLSFLLYIFSGFPPATRHNQFTFIELLGSPLPG